MFQFVVRVFFHWPSVLRNSKAVRAGKLLIWSGAALVASARLCRIRVGDSDSVRTKLVEGVVFPGSWMTWVLRYIEIRQLTLSHAVEVLATTVR